MNAITMKDDELLNFMKSLADAERLKIAGLLSLESLSPTQVAERLEMKPAEVQRHLDELIAAGLAHKEGSLYRLDSQALEKLTHQVLAQSRPPAPKYEGDEFEIKTLRAYFSPDGTLKAIPTQHKKLMVILNQLVRNFERGEKYPESQVNQILRRFHEDTAALRRYMVDNKLLRREKAIYWRTDEPS
jgi:DNA-binding transcriptional ArsR family regulator